MIGRRVGSYTIESELGMGGMGAVYRARHVMLGRMAAIKILLPQFSANPQIVQRFFNEARAATEIHHLGIVEVFDFGQMDDGSAYIAMELLDGESLAARMRKRGDLGVAASIRIIRQMCGPLGAAHERGIVHRDLKPDNVYIVPDAEVPGGERIKLLDFGIAKISSDSAMQTSTGAIMGTPMYMAPEQCRGVAVDYRADLYALGCMLYELVAHRTPFLGEGAGDIMGGHMYQQPPALPTSNVELATLVTRMLAKQPGDRPQSTREVADALDRILEARNLDAKGSGLAIGTGPTIATGIPGVPPAQTTLSGGVASRIEPPSMGRRRAGLVVAGGLGLLGIGALVFIVATRRDNSNGAPMTKSASIDAPTIVSSATIADATPLPAPPPDAAVPVVDAHVSVIDAQAAVAKAHEPATITLSLASVPPGANVSLTGKPIGQTPLVKLAFPAGHKLIFTVVAPGREPATVSFDGTKSESRSVSLRPIQTGPTDPPHKDPPRAGSDKLDENGGVNPFAH